MAEQHEQKHLITVPRGPCLLIMKVIIEIVSDLFKVTQIISGKNKIKILYYFTSFLLEGK